MRVWILGRGYRYIKQVSARILPIAILKHYTALQARSSQHRRTGPRHSTQDRRPAAASRRQCNIGSTFDRVEVGRGPLNAWGGRVAERAMGRGLNTKFGLYKFEKYCGNFFA